MWTNSNIYNTTVYSRRVDITIWCFHSILSLFSSFFSALIVLIIYSCSCFSILWKEFFENIVQVIYFPLIYKYFFEWRALCVGVHYRIISPTICLMKNLQFFRECNTFQVSQVNIFILYEFDWINYMKLYVLFLYLLILINHSFHHLTLVVLIHIHILKIMEK